MRSHVIPKPTNNLIIPTIINNIINLLNSKTTKKIIKILDCKIQVLNAIAIGIIFVKFYYNKSKKPLFFKVKQEAYIRLYKSYKLLAAKSKKLSK